HPHCLDSVFLGKTQRNGKKSRKHLNVFVTIEMRWTNPRRAYFFYLCVPLRLYFFRLQTLRCEPEKQCFRSAGKIAIFIQQAFYFFGGRDRFSVAQIQMHSHAQSRRLAGRLHACFGRTAVRNQGSARHNPVAVSFRNSAIYAVRPSQIVRVDDQVSHFSAPIPVHSYSYPIPSAVSFVPLTAVSTNFSMAVRRTQGLRACTCKPLSRRVCTYKPRTKEEEC